LLLLLLLEIGHRRLRQPDDAGSNGLRLPFAGGRFFHHQRHCDE
jgi:hypothetical protein